MILAAEMNRQVLAPSSQAVSEMSFRHQQQLNRLRRNLVPGESLWKFLLSCCFCKNYTMFLLSDENKLGIFR